jgi:hypothetical protein
MARSLRPKGPYNYLKYLSICSGRRSQFATSTNGAILGKAVSLFSTPATFADTLRRRLVALAERQLISQEGNLYAITDEGLSWLKGFSVPTEERTTAAPSPKRTSVAEAARAHNDEQLGAFRQRLMQLEPVQFEHFVKELLDAMDYEDVQVTKVGGDKGVDVIARVQFGITEITEVVQVKRTETTITRQKVDELRGALPYFKAIRGTIISLGNFAKGAQEGALFVGAAPITLIDGKRLLDLCIKHEVGVRRRPVEIYEIDEAFLCREVRCRRSRRKCTSQRRRLIRNFVRLLEISRARPHLRTARFHMLQNCSMMVHALTCFCSITFRPGCDGL